MSDILLEQFEKTLTELETDLLKYSYSESKLNAKYIFSDTEAARVHKANHEATILLLKGIEDAKRYITKSKTNGELSIRYYN